MKLDKKNKSILMVFSICLTLLMFSLVAVLKGNVLWFILGFVYYTCLMSATKWVTKILISINEKEKTNKMLEENLIIDENLEDKESVNDEK